MLGLLLTFVFLAAGFFAWSSKDMYLALHLFALSAAFYFCWQITVINNTLKNSKEEKKNASNNL